METASRAILDFNHLQLILVSIIGISGAFLILWAGSHLRKRHLIRSSLGAGFGAILISLAISFFLIISNLYTYQRLSHEQLLAKVHMQQLNDQHYLITLDFLDTKPSQIFELKGDEWQIDARILKWKYPIIWLGLDSHYQFERISGRYIEIDSERNKERTVYNLTKVQTTDVWPIIRKHQHYIPLIDALYGTASYVPMRDQAEYEVSLSQTGLIVRPLNSSAEGSISNWR